MVPCLRLELKRAFTSKGMLFALLFACLLATHHFIMDILDATSGMAGFASEAALHVAMNFSPDFIWMHWMPADAFSFHGYLYFLLLPLLAGLPHAGSLLRDRADHYAQVICTRVSRGTYLCSKWIATFVSGGVAAVVPCALSFLLLLTRYPVINPVAGAGHQVAQPTSMFAELYMTQPLAWVALWLGILFVVGGVLATLGLAVTYITEYGLIVHVLPFLLLYVLTTVFTALGCGTVSPLTIIDPSRNVGCPFWLLALEFGLLACAGAIPLAVDAKREAQ